MEAELTIENPLYRAEELAGNFCLQWPLPQDQVSEIAKASVKIVNVETQFEKQVTDPAMRSLLQSIGITLLLMMLIM